LDQGLGGEQGGSQVIWRLKQCQTFVDDELGRYNVLVQVIEECTFETIPYNLFRYEMDGPADIPSYEKTKLQVLG